LAGSSEILPNDRLMVEIAVKDVRSWRVDSLPDATEVRFPASAKIGDFKVPLSMTSEDRGAQTCLSIRLSSRSGNRKADIR